MVARPRRHSFRILPDQYMAHPDCRPLWRLVIWAVGYLADDCRQCDATIAEIAETAGVGRNTARDSIDWMLSVGGFVAIEDGRILAGRRLAIAWRMADVQYRAHPNEGILPEDGGARPGDGGARPAAGGRAPSGRGASFRRHGGARLEDTPLFKEENLNEREENVPSRIPEVLTAVAASEPTGRDESASLLGEGEGRPEPPAPIDESPPSEAEYELAIAECEEALAGLRHGSKLRDVLEADLAGLRERNPDALARRRPRSSPDLTPPPAYPCGPPPKPKPRPFECDQNYSFDRAIKLCRRLDAPDAGPHDAELWARHLAGRWRDPKPDTLKHFVEAASLGTGLLETLILQAERKQLPSHWFSTATGEELRGNRKAHRTPMLRPRYAMVS